MRRPWPCRPSPAARRPARASCRRRRCGRRRNGIGRAEDEHGQRHRRGPGTGEGMARHQLPGGRRGRHRMQRRQHGEGQQRDQRCHVGVGAHPGQDPAQGHPGHPVEALQRDARREEGRRAPAEQRTRGDDQRDDGEQPGHCRAAVRQRVGHRGLEVGVPRRLAARRRDQGRVDGAAGPVGREQPQHRGERPERRPGHQRRDAPERPRRRGRRGDPRRDVRTVSEAPSCGQTSSPISG